MAFTSERSRVIRFGAFEADLRSRELRKHGLKIKLQEQPFQVLAMLLERPGDLVTRDEIRAKLWPEDTFVDFDHGLNAAIRRLREALNDSADVPRFVETLPKRGYRFIGQVENPSHSTQFQSAFPETSATPAPSPAGAAGSSELQADNPERPATVANMRGPTPLLSRGRMPIAVAKAGALLVILAMLIWRLWPVNTPIDSIAILPFVNETHDSRLDYLTDGITETIINNLAQIPSLKVTSRNAAFVFRGRPIDTKAVAQGLGVRAILVGNLSAVASIPTTHGDASDVRLDLELVDTLDNRRLWGEQYTIKSVESNGILAEISDRVTEKLALRFSPAIRNRVARRHTENNAAFDAYLRGMFFINQRGGTDPYRQALGYFREALDLDPNYALADDGASAALGLLAFYGGMAPARAYSQEEVFVRRALELDPELADAHIQRGYLLQALHRDFAGAEQEFLRALQLQPYSGAAHHALALHLSLTGRSDESLAEARRAAELEPSLPPSQGTILWMEYFAHRFSEMDRSLKELQDSFPHCMEALQAEAVGHYSRAVAEIEQANWSSGTLCSLPHIYAVAGRRADAQRILNQMLAGRNNGYISAYQIALVYAGLGERAEMLHWLQTADREADPWMIWSKQDPRLDQYRSMPEFAAIEQRAFTAR